MFKATIQTKHVERVYRLFLVVQGAWAAYCISLASTFSNGAQALPVTRTVWPITPMP
jgi:hypothetical protein